MKLAWTGILNLKRNVSLLCFLVLLVSRRLVRDHTIGFIAALPTWALSCITWSLWKLLAQSFAFLASSSMFDIYFFSMFTLFSQQAHIHQNWSPYTKHSAFLVLEVLPGLHFFIELDLYVFRILPVLLIFNFFICAEIDLVVSSKTSLKFMKMEFVCKWHSFLYRWFYRASIFAPSSCPLALLLFALQSDHPKHDL
jgi:hypothetical protein